MSSTFRQWFSDLPVIVKAVATLATVGVSSFSAGVWVAGQRFVSQEEFEQVELSLTVLRSELEGLKTSVRRNSEEMDSQSDALTRIEYLVRQQSVQMCRLVVEMRGEPAANADRCFM